MGGKPSGIKEAVLVQPASKPIPKFDDKCPKYVKDLCRVPPFRELDMPVAGIPFHRRKKIIREMRRLIDAAMIVPITHRHYVCAVLFDLVERWLPFHRSFPLNPNVCTAMFNKLDEFIGIMLSPSYIHQDTQLSSEDCLTQYILLRAKIGAILGKPLYKNFMPTSTSPAPA